MQTAHIIWDTHDKLCAFNSVVYILLADGSMRKKALGHRQSACHLDQLLNKSNWQIEGTLPTNHTANSRSKSRQTRLCWFKSDFFNSLRPRQNGRHLPNDILKCIFLNEYVWISIKISLKFVRKGPIKIIPALVQIMAWRRPGDKPLSEPMMFSLLTHICVTRPQWVKLKL